MLLLLMVLSFCKQLRLCGSVSELRKLLLLTVLLCCCCCYVLLLWICACFVVVVGNNNNNNSHLRWLIQEHIQWINSVIIATPLAVHLCLGCFTVLGYVSAFAVTSFLAAITITATTTAATTTTNNNNNNNSNNNNHHAYHMQ